MNREYLFSLTALGILSLFLISSNALAGDTDYQPLPMDLACPDELFEIGRCDRYVDLDWLEQDNNARLAIKPLQNNAGEVPADTVKVYARLRYWHDFRYSLPPFRIHVESFRPDGYQTYYTTYVGNIYWLDWEYDEAVPMEDGTLRLIPAKLRHIQAIDVPLAPGFDNRISLEVRIEDVWHKIREKLVKIDSSYKVIPVKLHYIHYGQQWDFRLGAQAGYPYMGFGKMFDRATPPHCESPDECTTLDDCDFLPTNYPPETAGRMYCEIDFQCPGVCEDKTHCFYTAIWGEVCYVPRLCLPGSCYHNWSVDEYISPMVEPNADDPGYVYESCRVLFTADTDPGDGYNPEATMHIIDMADPGNYQYLAAQFNEISSTMDVQHAFNCGGDKLRKYAVKIAERDDAMQPGDGMVHAFLTRSLTESPFNCRMDHPAGENCSDERAAGITSRIEMPGAAYFFVALEPGCQFNETSGHAAGRTPYALAAAHEIGHIGRLSHACNKQGKDSPKWGNLMCPPGKLENPEVSNPYSRQNFHMFAKPDEISLCRQWSEGSADLGLLDLNAR
jgi:hypothetical protein